MWKSNDGGSAQPAYLWSQQLSSDGLSLVGAPHLLLAQDMVDFPFESTIENPDMAYTDGAYFLLFSAGIWNSPSYSETYATCAGPIGPCVQHQASPVLSSYPGASGRGAGPCSRTSGHWMVGYAAWQPGCTDYSCGGARRLFVAPATLEPTRTGLTGDRNGLHPGRQRLLAGGRPRCGIRPRLGGRSTDRWRANT